MCTVCVCFTHHVMHGVYNIRTVVPYKYTKKDMAINLKIIYVLLLVSSNSQITCRTENHHEWYLIRRLIVLFPLACGYMVIWCVCAEWCKWRSCTEIYLLRAPHQIWPNQSLQGKLLKWLSLTVFVLLAFCIFCNYVLWYIRSNIAGCAIYVNTIAIITHFALCSVLVCYYTIV